MWDFLFWTALIFGSIFIFWTGLGLVLNTILIVIVIIGNFFIKKQIKKEDKE